MAATTETPPGRAAPTALGVAAGAVLTVGLLAAGVLPVPVLVLSIPFVWMLARRPVLRRLAVRNAARRPRETALVLLGALLGTAIITGSAVVGDTLGSSIRRGAYERLGPLDLVVRSGDPAAAPRLTELVTSRFADDPRIDGVLPLTVQTAAVSTTGAEPKAEPGARIIEFDFDAARRFGGDPDATGITGPTPTPGTAVIAADLADAIGAETGDDILLYAYGQERTYTIDRVLPRWGVAGFGLDPQSRSRNLFVAPGTLAELWQGAAAPPTFFVALSAAGGVIDGADTADRLLPDLEAAVASEQASVRNVKRDLLNAAEQVGAQFTQLFTSLGIFSVIAGILLLLNIFVMLAQERKTELGMLRAVGLRRAGLIGFFSLEGWMYALGSAALGTLVGIGVGRVIVLVAAGIFGSSDFGLEVHFVAHLSSIQGGFLVGFLISLVTVMGTSIWISRLNVIRAIRDLPEPPHRGRRVLWAVFGALGLLLGLQMIATGLQADDPFRLTLGPALAGLGAVGLLDRVVPRRPLVTLVSASVLTWSLVAFDVAAEAFATPEITLFVASGVTLTAAAVALVSQNQETIGALLRRLGGGSKSMSLRLGLAYPLARRGRTALILTMFALVMFTLTAITFFSSVFSNQIETFAEDVAGGYDVQVWSNAANPLQEEPLKEVAGVAEATPTLTAPAEFQADGVGEGDFSFWPVAGITPEWVDIGPPSLQVDEGVDERPIWQRLISDPNAVIVNEFFLQQGGGPPQGLIDEGDQIVLRDPQTGATRQFTVLALSDASFGFGPAYMAADVVRDVFGERAVPTMWSVVVEPGASPEDVAARINGRFVANGADAISFREQVATGLAEQQQFFRLMQGYLALGLVVGIAGLGVVMVRAVRERHRDIGVLRSLGFEARQVRRAFVAETAFVALEGIVIGAALAVVTSWRLLTSGAFGGEMSFAIPWGAVLILVAFTFAVTLLATAAPAQQASRIRPAVALRMTD